MATLDLAFRSFSQNVQLCCMKTCPECRFKVVDDVDASLVLAQKDKGPTNELGGRERDDYADGNIWSINTRRRYGGEREPCYCLSVFWCLLFLIGELQYSSEWDFHCSALETWPGFMKGKRDFFIYFLGPR